MNKNENSNSIEEQNHDEIEKISTVETENHQNQNLYHKNLYIRINKGKDEEELRKLDLERKSLGKTS